MLEGDCRINTFLAIAAILYMIIISPLPLSTAQPFSAAQLSL